MCRQLLNYIYLKNEIAKFGVIFIQLLILNKIVTQIYQHAIIENYSYPPICLSLKTIVNNYHIGTMYAFLRKYYRIYNRNWCFYKCYIVYSTNSETYKMVKCAKHFITNIYRV
ncbi:MAG: hypothetical protein K0R14_1894 [Burkholderiales bacterium]|jgi:hypothetical protein|nr:hypothetical protein [Burkholderiales bacterium]